jgi:RimJ/RimL family protein N-acetyltransferase
MCPTPVPYPAWTPVRGLTPLTRAEADRLAETLPVTPFNVIPYAGLQCGLDRVFVSGPRTAPVAIVLEHRGTPGEPEFLGSNPEAGWALLSRIPGWFCLNGTTEELARFPEIFAREVPGPLHHLGDLFYTLETAPIAHPHPAVRLLGPDDVPLMQRYPPQVWGNSYRTFEELLTKGAAAGAVIDGELVAVALVSAVNPRYADVGVHTREPFRRRGLSAAAASLVAEAVRYRGLVPIWSTGGNNLASQRVAEKVGFRRRGEGEYLVLDDLKKTGGFQPR